MKKALNVKNMKETLINYSGTQDEMNRISQPECKDRHYFLISKNFSRNF